jgi:hypothetical protein
MKRKDWECPICGEAMVKTSWPYMVCLNVHGKLHRAWDVNDLPLASRYDYKRFTIAEEDGYWEYCPHVHHGCMYRPPVKDTIVAKVPHGRAGNYRKAMVFRSAEPPRGG